MDRRAIIFCGKRRGWDTAPYLVAWKALLAIALSVGIRSFAEGADQPGSDFRFHGQPVHPLLIKEFEPWISDERPPITVEVNVSAARDSNQYAASFKTETNGVVSAKLQEGGSFSYKYLGKLSDDTHVLRTSYLGGGSGLFEALLFVRFRTSSSYLADGMKRGEQTFLRAVRRFPLGDRDDAEVLVKQDQVIVGKSRYRPEPVVLKFETPISSPDNKSNRKEKNP
jgi:hypothetical protein